MALEQSIWLPAITENLYRDNQFINLSLDWSEYAQKGIKTVVIPQIGSPSNVSRNRNTLPATITGRNDSDISFDMTWYTSDPRIVTDLEEIQLSYNKMQSLLDDDMKNMRQYFAEDILYAWKAEGTKKVLLKTTGDADVATAPGATGNRKRLCFADFVSAQAAFDALDIPSDNRYALLPSNMLAQLFQDPILQKMNWQQIADVKKGIIGQIAGFTIMKRSKVWITSAAGAVKAPTADSATTDCEAGMLWHPSFVGKAQAFTEVIYESTKRADYYAQLFSMETYGGGRKRYGTGLGVGEIYQDTVS